MSNRPKKPSGETQPIGPIPVPGPSTSGSYPSIVIPPMPVVLTAGTIIKLASVILVPLIGIISSGVYFFHKTNNHIEDVSIHLLRDERPGLETKAEAKKCRKEMEESIKREFKVSFREIKQDVINVQTAEIKKLGIELKIEQKMWGDRVLGEVKQARKEIKGQ